MRVLKIVGDIDIAIDVPEGTEIITTDMETYLNTTYEEKLDMIFCIHALQTLWGSEVTGAIEKLVNDLAHMGELHVHVPAIEQAAKSLIRGETDPLAFYLTWGTPARPFHCGFTLMWLRALIVQAGAIVREATMNSFVLESDGQELGAIGHAVLATVIRS